MKTKLANMPEKLKIKPAKQKGFVKAVHAFANHPKSATFQKAFNRHKAMSVWERAVGAFFEGEQNHSKALDFKDGILFIACLTKELANKIKMFAQRIIYLLNQLIGKDLVFGLKVEF